MSKLFDTYAKSHHKRGEKKAWKNPEWAAIEKIRVDNATGTSVPMIDESVGLTWEAWETQNRIWHEINPTPIWFKIHWWLGAHGVRAQSILGFSKTFRRGSETGSPKQKDDQDNEENDDYCSTTDIHDCSLVGE